MEMFNVHRRDIMSMEDYMDLKKPGFGGPKSAKMYRDGRGKRVNTDPKLADYQRVVDRHPAFGHPVYNPTYKAMSGDLVYKQERKKPYTYPDPYLNMGIPVVNVGRAANEGRSYTSFQKFINEEIEMDLAGMNPRGEETKVSLRGKTDADAIADAEDRLDDMRIEWNTFFKHRDRNQIDFLDKDGDLVAYVDAKARKLYVMPDAPTMQDEPRMGEYGATRPEEEDFVDEYEMDELESEEAPEFSQPEARNADELERKLRSFERMGTRPFEDDEDEDEFED